MARTAAAKLTSEERCRKAFEEWYGPADAIEGPNTEQVFELSWLTWQAAWRYLESRVTDYIEK